MIRNDRRMTTVRYAISRMTGIWTAYPAPRGLGGGICGVLSALSLK
jgi:hypothetical protein